MVVVSAERSSTAMAFGMVLVRSRWVRLLCHGVILVMVKLTVDPRGMSLFRWCRLAADWRIFAVSFSRVIRLDLVQLASVCGSWWVSPTCFCSENSDLLVLSLLLRSPMLSVLTCASLWCWWVHGWARFGAFIFLMVWFVPSQTLGCLSSVMVRVVCFRFWFFFLWSLSQCTLCFLALMDLGMGVGWSSMVHSVACGT